MTPPSRASRPIKHFSAEHQRRAAQARHSGAYHERAAFKRLLATLWNNGAMTGGDIPRFVSVVRSKIYRGEFASHYTVTRATLCDWLCAWRKGLGQIEPAARVAAPGDR